MNRWHARPVYVPGDPPAESLAELLIGAAAMVVIFLFALFVLPVL